jgi:uncharacterized protein
MKYLLVFLVIFLVAWRWRTARTADQIDNQRKRTAKAAVPSTMVPCAQCGVHLPATEAVRGQLGMYCSTGHRQLMEP